MEAFSQFVVALGCIFLGISQYHMANSLVSTTSAEADREVRGKGREGGRVFLVNFSLESTFR